MYMWDDSGPMITACAYSGSVNREREVEEVKEGRKGKLWLGEGCWEGKSPPYPTWQAHGPTLLLPTIPKPEP